MAMSFRKSGLAALILNCTVYLSGQLTSCGLFSPMTWAKKTLTPFISNPRSHDQRWSSQVISLPAALLMPFFRLNVHVNPSDDDFQLSAQRPITASSPGRFTPAPHTL